MKKSVYKKGMAFLLSCVLAFGTCISVLDPSFSLRTFAYTEKQGTIIASSLNVRSGPGTGNASIARLANGTAVTVIGEDTASDGVLWYKIRFTGSGGAQTTGYVSSHYVKLASQNIVSDSDFETYMTQQGFPESYKQGLRELHSKYPKWKFTALQTGLDWNTAVAEESKVTRNLVARSSISSWKSTEEGAYDWATGTWPGFDGSSWVAASRDIISYYMDPRNFLNETYIYQFMNQSYDSSIHTREGLVTMVEGTFLSGTAPAGGASGSRGSSGSGSGSGESGSPSGQGGDSSDSSGVPGGGSPDGGEITPGQTGGPGASLDIPRRYAQTEKGILSVSSHLVDTVSSYGPGMDSENSDSSSIPGSEQQPGSGDDSSAGRPYVDIIMDAAAQSGVNPYILASMILVEQGKQGTGRSISGTVSGYTGYYNFFNIEAYQSGSMDAVTRGLWWASQSGSYGRPWNSREKSIIGGAKWYGDNYPGRGQNTLYLKKFNVQGSNPYTHQYMTNIQAAASEGAELAKISSLKNTALEFSIPVFKNMPEGPCAQPTLDGSPNNKLSSLGVDGFALTPSFNRDTESYDLIVDSSVSSVAISASAIDSKASVSGTGTVNLQNGNNDITIAVKAENGHVRNYIIHVVRQDNGPTYSESAGGSTAPGNTSGPGSSSGPGGDTTVEIVGPPGSTQSGGSGTSAPGSSDSGGGSSVPEPIAPDGSVEGFGTEEQNGVIQSPDSGSHSQKPGESGGSRTAAAGTSIQALAAQIQSEGAGASVKIYTSSGKEASGNAATGYLVQAYDSNGDAVLKQTIIVRGDNTGDGKVNVLDILNAQRHILGLGSLKGEFKTASDVNGNGKIDITDILAMQRDVLGIEKLK